MDLIASNVSVEYVRLDFDANLLRSDMQQRGAGSPFPDSGVRGYIVVAKNAGEGARATLTIYFFRAALFVFVVQEDGVSLHLRNAGTTSACSSVGSLRLVRVSLVRLAPALYPIF